MNLRNLAYCREILHPKEIFPNFHKADFLRLYEHPTSQNPHEIVLETLRELWQGRFTEVLNRYGFHEEGNKQFGGHCHQITPVLGVMLKARGFDHVAYLEGMRVYPYPSWTQYPPELEASDLRAEFCDIGRIPYCCLEVRIGAELFYLSGKHVKPGDRGEMEVLLTPTCYRSKVGSLAHPDDPIKSGIYLEPVVHHPVIWKKQTRKDPAVEFFRTFAHMQLEW